MRRLKDEPRFTAKILWEIELAQDEFPADTLFMHLVGGRPTILPWWSPSLDDEARKPGGEWFTIYDRVYDEFVWDAASIAV